MNMYFSVKFGVLLLFWCICTVFCEELSPIYANHFFARQFFQYFNQTNISSECKTVSDYVKHHQNENWALKLIDASGVVGSGLAKGNFQLMGDFDECLEINVKISNQLINGFIGQYCTLDLPMQALVGTQTKNNSRLEIEVLGLNPSIGVCLPSTCSQTDLMEILKTFSSKTGMNVTVSNCTDSLTNNIHWYHVLIISAFMIIILLIITGTIVDTTKLFVKSKLPKKLINSLKSFSIHTNTVKLFSVGNEKETIGCFHGFRLMSLLFIIIYHIYTEAQLPSANLLEILEGEKDFMLQIVTNAGLWVESFFLLSGFLCTNGVIRQFRGTPSKKYNPISNIIHRYIRLTPSLLGIIAFSILQEIMVSGPQWHRYVASSQTSCHKNWWTNLLYINNIVGLNQLGKPESECVGFTWYLAVDMQLFLISPILIIFLASSDVRKQYLGIGINVLVIVLSWIITAVITVENGLTPTVLMTVYDLDYINKVYKQTYCRVGPYCVGVLMAYFYNKHRGSLVIKPRINLILWVVSIALNLGITFLTWPWLMGKSYHNWASVLYGSTHRTLWALSWAYILFACSTNHGSFINSILSWKALVPLSRLSFQAYLYHSVIMSAFVYGARQPIHASKINLVMMFFQYTVLTFVVSYIAFLMFEFPFSNLEKILFSGKNKNITIETRQQINHDSQQINDTLAYSDQGSRQRNYGTNNIQD